MATAPRRTLNGEADRHLRRRLRDEAALIAKGHADIDGGLGIDDEALEAWLDQLGQDDSRPPPVGGR